LVDSFKIFTDFNKNYRYQWLKDEIELKNATSHQIFVKDKSSYRVNLTKANGCIYTTQAPPLKTCETATDNRAIILTPPTIVADKTNFYAYENAILKTESCSNVNFQWLKNTQTIEGANENMLKVKENGSFSLKIEKFGCTAFSNSISISVENVLENEEKTDFLVEIYPNPVSENLKIRKYFQTNKPTDIQLRDITGKNIKQWQFNDFSETEIDLKNMVSGVYFLSIENENRRIVKKIVLK
jgi:hypothetical protein